MGGDGGGKLDIHAGIEQLHIFIKLTPPPQFRRAPVSRLPDPPPDPPSLSSPPPPHLQVRHAPGGEWLTGAPRSTAPAAELSAGVDVGVGVGSSPCSTLFSLPSTPGVLPDSPMVRCRSTPSCAPRPSHLPHTESTPCRSTQSCTSTTTTTPYTTTSPWCPP